MNQPLTLSTAGLLLVPPLMWAGNAVVGRLVAPLVPPMTLNLLRWVIAFVLLLAFMFVGRPFLAALQLTEISLRIGGGVILFLIALRMIFPPQPGGVFGTQHMTHEPLIVPLAIPALAGPSALVTVLLFSSQGTMAPWLYVAVISLVAVVWLAVLLSAERLQRALGDAVMTAFERLMGLILTAIAIEMLLAGIRAYIASL